MHAARLEYERQDAPAARPTAKPKSARSSSPQEIHVGCSGWYYWHWRESFYPEGLASSRWFAHYASRFDTVELNAPFYSWPTLATIATWNRQAGRRKFVYTIKV